MSWRGKGVTQAVVHVSTPATEVVHAGQVRGASAEPSQSTQALEVVVQVMIGVDGQTCPAPAMR